jgi:hypothetical protein
MTGAKPREKLISRSSEKAADFDWLHARREEEERLRDGARARPSQPSTVLCDEGELDDLYQMLRSMDQRLLRVRPQDIDDLREWERPGRLFVTSVHVAIAHPLTLIRDDPDLVSIAVADGDAHTVVTAMLRQGFRYVVRRPAHPEAIRLLLMQVLYRGPEQRDAARFPFGGEIGWRSGLRRGSCVMSEISARGCRLLTQEPVARGSRIHIRVPPALADSRALRLRGRVLRRDLSNPEGAPCRTHLVIGFEGVSARARAHLDALLAERASGPALTLGQTPAAARRRHRLGPSRFLSLTETGTVGKGAVAGEVDAERDQRSMPRSVWQGEVVTLEAGEDRVQLTLMGSDLSEGGMRVEPHPLLQLGERLRIAIYDAKRSQPLVLDTRVARDDGSRGCGLAFERVDPATRESLRTLVAEGTRIASLGPGAKRAESVVLGRIVADPAAEQV